MTRRFALLALIATLFLVACQGKSGDDKDNSLVDSILKGGGADSVDPTESIVPVSDGPPGPPSFFEDKGEPEEE
jgi:hypothetical protein